MSGGHQDKVNENADGFNLSKEELMNCFGSQICSQSNDSNYDYEDGYAPNEIQRKNIAQNLQNKDLMDVGNTSKKFGNYVNKDDILRNICHGFVDMFFSQKEELRGIKEEIRKLQNIMLNNSNVVNNNRKGNTKIDKFNNQKSFAFNQNNNYNSNEMFNYNLKNSKKNNILNNTNYSLIDEDSSQINLQKKENKRDQKKIPLLGNSKIIRAKSPNIRGNPKIKLPEIVLEVDEEYEITSTNKQNKIKDMEKGQQKENIFQKGLEDPFQANNSQNENFKFEDIKDDEFDEILKRGKNKNDKISNPFLFNDPFQKSSELKIKPNKSENNLNNDNLIEDNNLGLINLDSDEIVSDFMVGGKKINIKLNDDIRKKINSFDQPIDKLEELDKNKEPSNIIHKTSKLSTSSIVSKAKNIMNESHNSRKKFGKRNYNTMIENSKNIVVENDENFKNEESKKNGSSAKERGKFQKTLKKFEKYNEYNIQNNLDIIQYNNNSTSNSIKNTQKSQNNKKIENKKYIYNTISSCQFYCLCTKKNKKDKHKCEICKDSKIINIKNFMLGFHFYIIKNKESNKTLEIDTSDSTFKLLKSKTLKENDSNFTQFKELEQFFRYQFVFLTYDKYLKVSNKKNNIESEQIENLIEEIYDKLVYKYIYVFIKGKRSFLTEICEGDSTLGHMNISLFLMNISNNPDSTTGEKTIEFSDGFKSCYSIINNRDPINKLMSQIILHNWMNVEIGMSKVLNITEDFKLFIKIYYNSISPGEPLDSNKNNREYGPLLDKKYLHKNILEINNDGGEISQISVIIVKKYDYYVNNITKKVRYSRKKYENELMKIPEMISDRKSYNNNDSGEKNNNEIKEPDLLFFNFKSIAMDYEIYNTLKKNMNNKNFLEHLLKKKYIIEFNTKSQLLYDNILEGKMYQLMFLNLEHKNYNNNNSLNSSFNYNNSNFFYNNNSKDNDIYIKFTDKSQINEIQLSLNYKAEKEYTETNEIINKNLNLTNSIDIGKVFIENCEKNKKINEEDYFNKEFNICGIYNGYIDKVKNNSSSKVKEEKNGENSDEYFERYIILSIGMNRVAIIKLHKEDFFFIDVKSNSIKDKIFNCCDILYKEILYFDNDNNQPKITGKQKFENSIPILTLQTHTYTSINYGNYTKNIEQVESFLKYKENNKSLVDMLVQCI